MEAIVVFDQKRTRNRETELLGARILEELVNGPLVVNASTLASLNRYKKKQKEAGVEVAKYRTQKLDRTDDQAGSNALSVVALAEGPFERYVKQPEWVK